MHGALALVCALSAITAVVALTVVDKARRVQHAASDQLTRLETVRVGVARLAAAGERVVLTGDGQGRFGVAHGELARARAALHGLAAEPRLADDVAAVERGVDDVVTLIDRSVGAHAADPRDAFLAYRELLAPARDAVDDGATVLARTLAARRDAAADRTAVVVTRARWALGLTGLVGVAMAIAFAGVILRELVRLTRRARMAAEQAKRNATSRQELLAAAAELRAPLQLILGAAPRLKAAPDGQLVDNIVDAATRLRELLEGLLDVSAVEAGATPLVRERCDTSALVETVATSLELLASERGVRVRVDAATPILLDVDRRRLVQILGTLLGTAVRSARPGSEIAVTVQPAGGGARFAIGDGGSSELPAQLGALLRPTANAEPTSIELYVARRLVDAHGGRIGVEGSTVWFTVPGEPQLLATPAARARA